MKLLCCVPLQVSTSWPICHVLGVIQQLWQHGDYANLWLSTDISATAPKTTFAASMEKSPSREATSFSASQEISRILWNLKLSLPRPWGHVACVCPEPHGFSVYKTIWRPHELFSAFRLLAVVTEAAELEKWNLVQVCSTAKSYTFCMRCWCDYDYRGDGLKLKC